MLKNIFSEFNQFGLLIGIQSILIKSITAVIRFFLTSILCKNYLPNEFKDWIIFLGIVSIAPFFDFGISGFPFRKKLIENTCLNAKKSLLSSAFYRLINLYLVLSFGLIFLGQFFQKSFVYSTSLGLVFFRVPFGVYIEYLFAHDKMQIAYFIEIIEQTFLVLGIFLLNRKLSSEYLMFSYALSLFFFTVLSFGVFLKNIGWRLKKEAFIFNYSLNEATYSIHNLLSMGFLVFIPYMINKNLDVEDTIEFNIGFRIMTIGLGLCFVLFNPLTNYLIKKQKDASDKSFFIYLTMLVAVAFLLYTTLYPWIFKVFSGFYPENTLLHHQLIVWTCCMVIFYGLDHLLKIFSVNCSIVGWSGAFFIWMFFFR